MKYSEEVGARIIARLNQVAPNLKCPLCQTDNWVIANGYVFLPVHQHSFAFLRGGGSGELPCAAITCKVCGNTHLLNLVMLGLGDLLKD